jgi:hypothetical protein
MGQDRLLTILRFVVTPIVLTCIAGYFQSRTSANTAQTKASYETLAPNVLDLQDKVATLTGRLEEISKRPVSAPCPEAKKAAVPKVDAPKPHTGLGMLGTGKTELMVDLPELPPPAPQKIPARFEDMVQQQKK